MAGSVWEVPIKFKGDMSEIEQQTNQLKKGLKDGFTIDIGVDKTKVEKVINDLEKMLSSLGKGTGDFKQFEKLSKELQEVKGDIENVKKSLGSLDDKGMKNILTAINSIDASLTTLTTNLKGITSINTGGAEKEMKDLASAGDKVADSMERAAQAKKKLAETDLSSGGTVGGKKDRYANAKRVSEDEYNRNYQKYIDAANKQIKANGSTILGNSVDVKFIDGLAQVNAKIKEADGSWKSFSARIDSDGNIFNKQVKAVKKDINQLEAEFQNFGKDTPTIFDTSKQKEWLDSFNVLKELQKKSSELNNLNANNVNGKNDFAIQELKKEIESLEPAAEKARQTIQNLGTSAESLDKIGISAKQGAEAIDLINNAAKGSSKSIVSNVTTYEKFLNSANTDLAKFQKQKPMSETFSGNVTKLKTEITKYSTLLNQVKANGGIATDKENEQLNEYRNNISKVTTEIKEMSAAEKGAKEPGLSKIFKEINELRDKYSGMGKEFKRELNAIEFQFKKAGDSLNLADAKKQLVDFEAQLIRTGNNSKSLFDVIKNKAFYGLAGQIANMVSLYDVINVGKQGVQTVRELDTALTEMRKVSDETIQSLKEYQSTTFDVADAVGTTAEQIQNSTADWMRLGESMQEAAESAKVSNILLNVSEFDSIDSATESLVSMSQAYKDLSKIQIVDVLNNIGNRYSISTDGLATALQDSASSLVTANNDLNEAVSLITAGNAVTQDPSKVGAGLRTISLRLVGTEAAQQELSDLGEETDGMITTVSKLRDTIKSATAAATEDGKGFDILDDNGNYKSTYEIMQGLADLYDEIVKKDKELGTNNLNLLLETIAGKNRSNIAASILQNGDMLRSVMEDAETSDGSAQNELNSYLDSIDGKIAQLQNRAQQFWATAIDSGTIKGVVSALTQILEVITGIVDKIGLLPTVGAGVGIFTLFKNVGRDKLY